MAVPRFYELFNPLLQALKTLGGSASISELDDEVTQRLQLSDEDIAQPHDSHGTELQYQLAWARTYLKWYGLLNNSERGVWLLTEQGKNVEPVDGLQVVRAVREMLKRKRGDASTESAQLGDAHEPASGDEAHAQRWREDLMACLLRLSPAAFERLCQRLLRESGFVEVKVTGRSGDGGIDGVGIVRLGGLLGFPIMFQCKRYQGSVPAGVIRDFRGAMLGRAERGLVLTTGTFSRDAKIEATRDGAPPIDLVDGEQMLDKLKDLRLGVAVALIEEVSVVPSFFDSI